MTLQYLSPQNLMFPKLSDSYDEYDDGLNVTICWKVFEVGESWLLFRMIGILYEESTAENAILGTAIRVNKHIERTENVKNPIKFFLAVVIEKSELSSI